MNFSAMLRITALAAIAALATATLPGGMPQAQAGSRIEIVVNNQAITSVDIQRRIAFLKLQRAKGNLGEQARQQMTDEALKMQEVRRIRAEVPEDQVNASFARFASSNNMSTKQLTQILSQAGVTADHFKSYIRVQMSWPRVVQARYGTGQLSNQDLVAKMLERGGSKPSTTEYTLQQVILVVPANKRSKAMINARKNEAERLRAGYAGCDSTHATVAGLRDVAVRDLGRILQPQLPPDWKPLIEKVKAGQATATRVTDRGIEFIGVCSLKTVSDDVAAEMVFRAENQADGESEDAKKFLEELRASAIISRR